MLKYIHFVFRIVFCKKKFTLAGPAEKNQLEKGGPITIWIDLKKEFKKLHIIEVCIHKICALGVRLTLHTCVEHSQYQAKYLFWNVYGSLYTIRLLVKKINLSINQLIIKL
jgi:hypothetical protein